MHSKKEIFSEKKINHILKKSENPEKELVLEVITKGLKGKGLSLDETAVLLNSKNMDEQIFEASSKIKQKVYGNRIVFFAPLYISNYCINDCEYCGFHSRNKSPRTKLSLDEVAKQVEILEEMGHKRLLLEFGEDPVNNTIDYVVDVIKNIYAKKSGRGEIRRVNVNIAATTVENYKKLKGAGIGTYQLFQETYHEETYNRLHRGPKASYLRQLFAHNNALEAGIDDIGIGVLFGLYNYKFEVLALLSHSEYLNENFGVGPHTISVPRLQPAESVDFKPEYPVTEKELLKIIAILRLAVPYTGIIISTREKPTTRNKAFEIGATQTSAGSKTSPGGYGKKEELEQFETSDKRNVEQLVNDLLDQDYLPSFCTACYRSNRTGEEFMKLAKSANIGNICLPNAILTFKEYLEDYASKETKIKGEKAINNFLKDIDQENLKDKVKKKLDLVENKDKRDLFF